MKIAFIGLGVMGKPMAGHLIEAGHEVKLYRVKEESQSLVQAGGVACASAAEAVNQADVVILMLPDTPDVETVLFGERGIADTLQAGALLIDMSSISPVATKEFAQRLKDSGVGYVDAPVSGGETGAKEAKLTVMAGGSKADFDRAKPILELMAKTITRIGEAGDGQTAKVANQIIVGLTIQAVAEAMIFAAKAGADPAKVRTALQGGFASSRILDEHGQRMLDRDFQPGFRLNLHRKDLSLAIDAARMLNLYLPTTALVQQVMNGAIASGYGDLDHASLYPAMEAENFRSGPDRDG